MIIKCQEHYDKVVNKYDNQMSNQLLLSLFFITTNNHIHEHKYRMKLGTKCLTTAPLSS